jgi:hypothetical protein
MKKRNLLLVMLAIMLVLGMMMSCEPIEEEPGGPGEPPPWEPEDGFWGTYISEKYDGTITETIVFSVDSFTISDDSKAGGQDNYLDFEITEFDEWTNIPANVKTDYPLAFIFKGYVTAAYPVSNVIYGSQTGPGLGQSDITNKTPLKMLIYYNLSTGKLIRTAFVKESASIGAIILAKTGETAYRIYEEQ